MMTRVQKKSIRGVDLATGMSIPPWKLTAIGSRHFRWGPVAVDVE